MGLLVESETSDSDVAASLSKVYPTQGQSQVDSQNFLRKPVTVGLEPTPMRLDPHHANPYTTSRWEGRYPSFYADLYSNPDRAGDEPPTLDLNQSRRQSL